MNFDRNEKLVGRITVLRNLYCISLLVDILASGAEECNKRGSHDFGALIALKMKELSPPIFI